MSDAVGDPMPLVLRPAREEDADAIAEIYTPVVRDTAISFELVPPGTEVLRARVRTFRGVTPFLVAEQGERVVGYAYASPFHERPAYRFTVETSVYVREGERGRGVGRALYCALLARLVRQRFRMAVARITLPNPASVALHESLGFEGVGVLHAVGFKFRLWHDVGFWEKHLAPRVDDPPDPEPDDS